MTLDLSYFDEHLRISLRRQTLTWNKTELINNNNNITRSKVKVTFKVRFDKN